MNLLAYSTTTVEINEHNNKMQLLATDAAVIRPALCSQNAIQKKKVATQRNTINYKRSVAQTDNKLVVKSYNVTTICT